MRFVAALTLLSIVGGATAEPYWVEYDASSGVFPEAVGWQRVWGDEQGPWHGSGAVRSFEDGALVLDTLYDIRVDEYYIWHGPPIDPGPGETFVAEWRVQLSDLVGPSAFQVAVFSDSHTGVDFNFSVDSVRCLVTGVSAPFLPDLFHTFTLLSADMTTFELLIDGSPGLSGAFAYAPSTSFVAWGEGTAGSGSRCEWDYFSFGSVPEPSAAAMLAVAVACARRLRPTHTVPQKP